MSQEKKEPGLSVVEKLIKERNAWKATAVAIAIGEQLLRSPSTPLEDRLENARKFAQDMFDIQMRGHI